MDVQRVSAPRRRALPIFSQGRRGGFGADGAMDYPVEHGDPRVFPTAVPQQRLRLRPWCVVEFAVVRKQDQDTSSFRQLPSQPQRPSAAPEPVVARDRGAVARNLPCRG
ncbi:hypothetical protein GCM10009599_24090 [Luteococcus peritonei]